MSDLKDINDKLFINTFKTVIRIISILTRLLLFCGNENICFNNGIDILKPEV